jgi:hypothetical protein
MLYESIHLCTSAMQYASRLFTKAKTLYNDYVYPELDTIRPHRQYYMTTTKLEFQPSHEVVPDDCVYLEEWVRNGRKLCVVKYSGETIPDLWKESPFDRNARCPWIWVGDRKTETDLTRAFNKFLVVGNMIANELIERLTSDTDIFYIESGTFNELKFPEEGLVIEEYVDAVPDS